MHPDGRPPYCLGWGKWHWSTTDHTGYCLCSNKHRNGLSRASCNDGEGEGRGARDHRDKLLSWAAFPGDSLLRSHGHLVVSQATFKGHGTMCVNFDFFVQSVCSYVLNEVETGKVKEAGHEPIL